MSTPDSSPSSPSPLPSSSPSSLSNLYHQFPLDRFFLQFQHPRVLSIIVYAILWLALTSWRIKLQALLMSMTFSAIEFIFYGLTEWGPNDEVLFTPHKFSFSRCHTTWEMFWTNMAYMPIFVEVYRYLIPSVWLRVILFPINVWIAEVVIGSYLLHIWERRAWIYKGRDAYFNGMIKINYFPLWILLGCIFVVALDWNA